MNKQLLKPLGLDMLNLMKGGKPKGFPPFL